MASQNTKPGDFQTRQVTEKRCTGVLCLEQVSNAACFFTSIMPMSVQDNTDAKTELHIDVPVKLQKAMWWLWDMPFLLGDLGLLDSDYSDWKTEGTIVGVFHGDIACLVWNRYVRHLEKPTAAESHQ